MRHLMLQRMTVKRRVLTATNKSAIGTGDYEAVASNLPCAIQALSVSERAEFGKVFETVTHRLFCETGTDILARDRISVGTTTYQILGVHDAAGRMHHIEGMLVERAES